jgi:hypothetical protein
MKKNITLVAIGLVIFTIIYALYFPNSREPITINTEIIWENPNISEQVISICPPFFATDKSLYKVQDKNIIQIDYPKQPELPIDLEWGKPKVLELYIRNNNPVLQIPLGFYEFADSWTFSRDIDNIGKNEDKNWSFVNNRLEIANDGQKIMIFDPQTGAINKISGDKVFFSLGAESLEATTRNPEKEEIVFAQDANSRRTVTIGNYIFKITEDGRIKRIVDDQVSAYLDRSFMGINITPLLLTTDGENLVVLLQNLSSEIDNSIWVQIYNKEFKWISDLVPLRGTSRPVSMCYIHKMIVTAWDDGFITGYSTQGHEVFRKYVSEGILDIVADTNNLYILTSKSLLKSRLFIKDTPLKIYPRFVYLGQVSSDTKFDLLIESKNPILTVKNHELKLLNLERGDFYNKATFELNTKDLEKFKKHELEIIVEDQNSKEIVIVNFFNLGKIKHITLFKDFAIDTKRGINYEYLISKDNIDLNYLEKTESTQIKMNKLTSEIMIFNP